MEKLKCWWCINDLTMQVFNIPLNYENKKFKVFGYCCSVNCVLAYIIRSSNITNQSHSINLMYKMYGDVLEKENIKVIQPSPPREILKIFGGKVDYTQYNNMKKKNYSNYFLFPKIPVNIYVENYDIINSNFKTLKSTSTDSSSNLVLKRKNPIKQKHIPIEKTIGITKLCSTNVSFHENVPH